MQTQKRQLLRKLQEKRKLKNKRIKAETKILEKRKREKIMRKQEKEKFNLDEAFVLWEQESKKGTSYLTGHDLNKQRLVGYFEDNKKNEKQPDIRIYNLTEDNKNKDEVCVLWITKSKEGKLYLTGLTNENEKIIAFYCEEKNETSPYLKAYFKEEK